MRDQRHQDHAAEAVGLPHPQIKDVADRFVHRYRFSIGLDMSPTFSTPASFSLSVTSIKS